MRICSFLPPHWSLPRNKEHSLAKLMLVPKVSGASPPPFLLLHLLVPWLKASRCFLQLFPCACWWKHPPRLRPLRSYQARLRILESAAMIGQVLSPILPRPRGVTARGRCAFPPGATPLLNHRRAVAGQLVRLGSGTFPGRAWGGGEADVRQRPVNIRLRRGRAAAGRKPSRFMSAGAADAVLSSKARRALL